MNNGNQDKGCGSGCTGMMWWMTLLVAVLAVPSFGIIATYLIPVKGIGEVVVFILACWLCTWLGMRLMQRPGMSKKVIGND